MTIEEAIKHAEEIAEENENDAQIWNKLIKDRLDFCDKGAQAENKCLKRAEEYRQLAEWLKELKQLREQEPFINKPCVAHQSGMHEDKVKALDKIRAEIEHEKTGYPPSAGYYKAIMRALQIIDKYISRKEKE